MNLYLAHPWHLRKSVREWELEFEARTTHTLINPFYDMGHDETNISDYNMIVLQDLQAIRHADGIVAFLSDTKSIGTHMELFYAATECLHAQQFGHESIYVIAEKGVEKHPWVRWCSRINPIFTSILAFEQWLEAQQ